MNSFEMTDIDGDALTFILRDGSTWITCTSGADEVTVGPFPAHLLRRALLAEPQQHEQFTTTFLGSSMPPSDARDEAQEQESSQVGAGEPVGAPALRLLDPLSEAADAPTAQRAPLASREG